METPRKRRVESRKLEVKSQKLKAKSQTVFAGVPAASGAMRRVEPELRLLVSSIKATNSAFTGVAQNAVVACFQDEFPHSFLIEWRPQLAKRLVSLPFATAVEVCENNGERMVARPFNGPRVGGFFFQRPESLSLFRGQAFLAILYDFVVVLDVFAADVHPICAVETQVNQGKGATRMADLIKVVESAVGNLQVNSSSFLVFQKTGVPVILKFCDESRLGTQRKKIVSPTTVGAAGVCFQYHIRDAVAVHIYACQLYGEAPIVFGKDDVAARVVDLGLALVEVRIVRVRIRRDLEFKSFQFSCDTSFALRASRLASGIGRDAGSEHQTEEKDSAHYVQPQL